MSVNERRCSSCGATAPPDAGYCSACGTELSQAFLSCDACGTPNDASALFCSRCGLEIDEPADDAAGGVVPAAIVQAEAAFFRSPGRQTSRAFDETDVAMAVKRHYGLWAERRTEATWWQFYGSLLEYAVEWPHAPSTVETLCDQFPEASGDPSIRKVMRHLSRPLSAESEAPETVVAAEPEVRHCACGRCLDADESFCSDCGKPRSQTNVPVSASARPISPDARKWVVGIAIAVALMFGMAVLGTRGKCIDTRLGMGIYSGLNESGGGDFDGTMGALTSVVRCPLGGSYSYAPNGGTVCSIHGRISESDLRARGGY